MRVTYLARKNKTLLNEMDAYTSTCEISEKEHYHLEKLKKSLHSCATISLYKENHEHKVTYLSSATCDNRFCFICNFLRQKRIRRKFWRYFQQNETLVVVKNLKSGKQKVVTNYQFANKFKAYPYSFIENVKYDLMHLTLTVPHYKETGFCGEYYYYETLIKKFNFLRKKEDWLYWVYGGEFGVETAMKESGLHIHIHALLFVRKGTQNRNHLHKVILKHWNASTVNPDNPRKEFEDWHIKQIMKGNKKLNELEARSLHPQGSTFLNLETIFTWNETKTEKVRASNWSEEAMILAVMETVSYHFEPHCWDKKERGFNIPLMVETMPHVHNKRLFNRFGCLLGEKPLGINYQDASDELKDVEELLVDEETGEVIPEYEYIITNPIYVNHFEDQDFDPQFTKQAFDKGTKLNCSGTYQAVDLMSQLVQMKHGKQVFKQGDKQKTEKNEN